MPTGANLAQGRCPGGGAAGSAQWLGTRPSTPGTAGTHTTDHGGIGDAASRARMACSIALDGSKML